MLFLFDIMFYGLFALAVIVASVRKKSPMPFISLAVGAPWLYSLWIDANYVGIPYISVSISYALALTFMAAHPNGGIIKLLLAVLFIIALGVNALCFFYAFGDRVYYSRGMLAVGSGQIALLLLSDKIRNMSWYDSTTRFFMDWRYSTFMLRYWIASDYDNIIAKRKETR